MLPLPRFHRPDRYFSQSIVRTEGNVRATFAHEMRRIKLSAGSDAKAERLSHTATNALMTLATKTSEMAEVLPKEDRYRVNDPLSPQLEKWLTWLAENWKTHFAEPDQSSHSASQSTSWDHRWWSGYSKWNWKDDDWTEDKW